MKPVQAGGRIVVFGSLNMDLVARVPRMPGPGETLAGHGFFSNAGGKGANQAVAAARQGAQVAMVGQVGADAFGAELGTALHDNGVDVTDVRATAEAPTGVAMILVDDGAQNCIAVIAGANAKVGPADAQALAERLGPGDLLLLQLEVPMDAVQRAAAVARERGATVVLNPAPAHALPEALWPLVDILVLNETEAGMLDGLPGVDAPSAADVGARLLQRGPNHVIVTLGAEGVVWTSAAGTQRFDAVRVKAVDTTAAGDTFIGALAARLAAQSPMDEAIAHGIRAAALSVTRAGAQASMPTLAEVAQFAP